MARAKDLSGLQYGRLTVLKRSENIGKDTAWLCKCECGNEVVVRTRKLTNNETKSCGCLKREVNRQVNYKDLKGQRFGRLLVLEETSQRYSGGVIVWKCLCDCGNIVMVGSNNLNNGHTKSCGCLQKDAMREFGMSRLDDLTNRRFGRLIVTDYYGKNKGGHYWICSCDCGANKVILHSSLVQGATKSCGCLAKDNASKQISKFNNKMWQDEEYINKMRGETHPHYNHNLTDEEREYTRNLEGYDDWSKTVKEQANYTCDCCGKRGVKLCSHHLDGYNWCKERRLDTTNGVCLCESCHIQFHKFHGYGNNTEQQYLSFKNKEEESYEI